MASAIKLFQVDSPLKADRSWWDHESSRPELCRQFDAWREQHRPSIISVQYAEHGGRNMNNGARVELIVLYDSHD